MGEVGQISMAYNRSLKNVGFYSKSLEGFEQRAGIIINMTIPATPWGIDYGREN